MFSYYLSQRKHVDEEQDRPRTEPCGAPCQNGAGKDWAVPRATRWYMPNRYNLELCMGRATDALEPIQVVEVDIVTYSVKGC